MSPSYCLALAASWRLGTPGIAAVNRIRTVSSASPLPPPSAPSPSVGGRILSRNGASGKPEAVHYFATYVTTKWASLNAWPGGSHSSCPCILNRITTRSPSITALHVDQALHARSPVRE